MGSEELLKNKKKEGECEMARWEEILRIEEELQKDKVQYLFHDDVDNEGVVFRNITPLGKGTNKKDLFKKYIEKFLTTKELQEMYRRGTWKIEYAIEERYWQRLKNKGKAEKYSILEVVPNDMRENTIMDSIVQKYRK